MGDIEKREDIILLVDTFYRKVMEDNLLSPVFQHVDWHNHLPIMYNFWSSMLLGDQTYKGNPFQKHIHLAINSSHFERWMILFSQSVDELFEGKRAGEVKDRARSIAGIFQHKLGLLK